MKRLMEEQIQDYYSEFKKIYNKQSYPKWFAAIDHHNKELGSLGYRCKCRFCPGSRINPKKVEHQLGHYAILQTPLHKEIKIVIVGKNNSWFDDKCGEKALEIAKSLKQGIPDRNFLTEGGSKFSRTLIKKFKEANAEVLLRNNTVGLNRVWLQTGTTTDFISNMQEDKLNGFTLEQICQLWTEEIIKIINPKLLLLLGTGKYGANQLFNFQKGYEHEHGRFYIQDCRHPSQDSKNEFIEGLENGLKELFLLEQKENRDKGKNET